MKKTEILLIILLLLPLGTGVNEENSSVRNVTLELKFNTSDVYVDGDTAEEKTYTSLDYPYILSDQPLGFVSYEGFIHLSYENSTSDIFQMTAERENSFLLVFSSPDHTIVEDQQEAVEKKTLMEKLEPSFGYFMPEIPTVKASYRFDRKIEGFNDTKDGFVELAIRNKFTDSNSTELLLEPS